MINIIIRDHLFVRLWDRLEVILDFAIVNTFVEAGAEDEGGRTVLSRQIVLLHSLYCNVIL